MTNLIKWKNPPQTDERRALLQKLASEEALTTFSRPTLEILVSRGMDTVEKIMNVLDDDIMNQHDPTVLKDSDKLIAELQKALKENKQIVVYGDFDCDGASATAIAVLALRHIGANVQYFINNRFKHGYGICPSGVTDLVERYPDVDVILTVDNGIVAFDGVKAAQEQGIQVLITDHHEPHPDGKLPPADAVVDPKRLDDEYPFKGLCGASLIYKMMMYLYAEMDEPLDYVYELVDIVGMATVGDVMPIVDENRLFVKESIRKINRSPRYAFKALKEAVGLSEIDEGTFGFKFVPIINSVGRLDGLIDKAVDMFLSTDPKEVDELVKYLCETNERRKELTAEQEEIAISMVEKSGVKPVMVLYHEDFHQGIVGLIAGRIKEKYHRPTIVLTKSNELWKGSGRSIDAFSLIDTLHEIPDILHHFGGHDAACGLGVEEKNLLAFEQAMIKVAQETLKPEDYEPVLPIDVFVEPSELTQNFVEELNALKPFGTSFETPNICLRNFDVQRTFSMGSSKQHLKLISGPLSVIMWSGVDFYEEIGSPGQIQVIGYPALNYWNGKTSVQLMVKDTNLRR